MCDVFLNTRISVYNLNPYKVHIYILRTVRRIRNIFTRRKKNIYECACEINMCVCVRSILYIIYVIYLKTDYNKYHIFYFIKMQYLKFMTKIFYIYFTFAYHIQPFLLRPLVLRWETVLYKNQ